MPRPHTAVLLCSLYEIDVITVLRVGSVANRTATPPATRQQGYERFESLARMTVNSFRSLLLFGALYCATQGALDSWDEVRNARRSEEAVTLPFRSHIANRLAVAFTADSSIDCGPINLVARCIADVCGIPPASCIYCRHTS